MNEKTVNINNFIGIYDNYITKEECNKAIKLYEDQDKFNKLNQDNQRTEYIGDSLVERNKKLEDKFKNSLTNRNGINNSGSLVIQDEINFTINDITI